MEKAFLEFMETIRRLRAPDGCPWDREQTPQTMRRFLLEETYEAIEAIDKDDADHLCEELGDVMLVAATIAQMHSEMNHFTVEDALRNVTEKLIRRHPHVFSGEKVQNSDEVLKNWEQIKKDEKKNGLSQNSGKSSVFDSISSRFSPLDRSAKIQEKAERLNLLSAGDSSVREKIMDFFEESKQGRLKENDTELILGKLLFLTVSFIRKSGYDSSLALQRANEAVESQFKNLEKSPNKKPVSLTDLL